MAKKVLKKAKAKRVSRCRGTRVEEVHGQFKNVPCKAPATQTRELRGDKPVELRYCDECAKDWDAQQAVLSSLTP